MSARISPAEPKEAPLLAALAGELLQEIMGVIREPVFRVDLEAMEARAAEWLEAGRSWVWLAREPAHDGVIGFVAAYEGHALYAEGPFGVISELFVRPAYRSQRVGEALVRAVRTFGVQRGWTRIEVMTPPLPQFDRTVEFYGKQGFVVTGGRKMKVAL